MNSRDNSSETAPLDVLRRIQDLFQELGRFGQTLTLTHAGQRYLAGCDDHSFTIYRLVEQCHLPPGSPGWPVCVVTGEAVIDETSPPHLPDDEFASGLTLPEWLDLIESLYRKG